MLHHVYLPLLVCMWQLGRADWPGDCLATHCCVPARRPLNSASESSLKNWLTINLLNSSRSSLWSVLWTQVTRCASMHDSSVYFLCSAESRSRAFVVDTLLPVCNSISLVFEGSGFLSSFYVDWQGSPSCCNCLSRLYLSHWH